MARIYTHAKCVLAWLGEESDGSTAALKLICEAADYHQQLPYSLSSFPIPTETQKDEIASLLRRAWFERVWILQEIAAARFLVLHCGNVELTGATLVTGLNIPELRALWADDSYLQNTIDAVTKLMGWTVLRRLSSPLSGSTSVPSLGIAPLTELLETFHTWKSSDQRDKIYALLGLSSDNAVSNLRPDYTKSWKVVFQEVISWILVSPSFIDTWEEREQAIITIYGSPLGTVQSANVTEGWILVTFRALTTDGVPWIIALDVPSNWCKNIRKGDVLFLFENRQHPSIVRFCHDHFDIILVSLSASRPRFIPAPLSKIPKSQPPLLPRSQPVPPSTSQCVANTYSKWTVVPRDYTEDNPEACARLWDGVLKSVPRSLRKLILVWDWSLGDDQHAKDHKPLMQAWENETSPNDCYTFPYKQHLPRISMAARIFEDLEDEASLFQVVHETSLPSHSDSPAQGHLALLRHVCRHWNSYGWLKQYLEKVKWCLWIAKRQQFSTSHFGWVESLSAYWLEEGRLRYDIMEMISLASREETAKKLQKQKHKRVPRQKFYQPIQHHWASCYPLALSENSERHHAEFITKLFVNSEQEINTATPTAHDISFLGDDELLNGKYFMNQLLARSGLDTKCTKELVIKIFEACLYGNEIMILMLLCENDPNALPLMIENIRHIKACTGYEDKLTFLLSQVADDPWATYSVLKEASRLSRAGLKFCEDPKTRVDRFYRTNLAVLKACVQKTDFCKVLVVRDQEDYENCTDIYGSYNSVFDYLCFTDLDHDLVRRLLPWSTMYECWRLERFNDEDIESFLKRWIVSYIQRYMSQGNLWYLYKSMTRSLNSRNDEGP